MTSQTATAVVPSTDEREWRAIPGWPAYEVSENGDVRRVLGGKGTRVGHTLKPWLNKQTGYLQVSLWRQNRGWKTTIHRLVALAFLGAPPTRLHLVAHNDGNRLNNHRTNLRWATQRENCADTLIHGTHNRGTRNGQAQLDEISVLAIRKMVAMKLPQAFIANGHGICRQSVSDIANRKRWAHLR
jgi:hypothetical protein